MIVHIFFIAVWKLCRSACLHEKTSSHRKTPDTQACDHPQRDTMAVYKKEGMGTPRNAKNYMLQFGN